MIRDYYNLEDGVYIDKHTELLKITTNPKVYISRRSLKHFIERRKTELSINYDKQQVLSRLNNAIDCVEIVLQKYDSLIKEEYKTIYTKHFEQYFKSSLRVVIEFVDGVLQVKSIHFQKTKKPPEGGILV